MSDGRRDALRLGVADDDRRIEDGDLVRVFEVRRSRVRGAQDVAVIHFQDGDVVEHRPADVGRGDRVGTALFSVKIEVDLVADMVFRARLRVIDDVIVGDDIGVAVFLVEPIDDARAGGLRLLFVGRGVRSPAVRAFDDEIAIDAHRGEQPLARREKGDGAVACDVDVVVVDIAARVDLFVDVGFQRLFQLRRLVAREVAGGQHRQREEEGQSEKKGEKLGFRFHKTRLSSDGMFFFGLFLVYFHFMKRQ